MRLVPALSLLCVMWYVAGAQPLPAAGQDVPFGQREIDKLPKSRYAEPLSGETSWYWNASSEQATAPRLLVHPKPSFRVGADGMERLCVVEAVFPGGNGQAGTLRFSCGDWSMAAAADWLAPKTQYRAMWLPATLREARAELVVGGITAARGEFATAEGAPPGVFEVDIPGEPVYVDHGFGLMPARHVMAYPGQRVRVRFAPGPTPRTGGLVSGSLRDTRGAEVGALRRRVGADRSVTEHLDTSGLQPGTYALDLKASWPEERRAPGSSPLRSDALARSFRVTLVAPAGDPGFGAHYTSLDCAAPVYVSRTETRPWQELWRGRELRDVVVTFPHAPYRFVFWRGTSFVPCWAFNSTWLCYEWLEAEPDFNGAIDCVEPIMDKECNNSRARIVAASPARVVIHWRYALTDFAQKVINDEWADETYTLYPDGVGTRKLVGWYKSGWHENQELIALNRPGNAPHQSLAPQALTLLTTDGRRQRPCWPRPYFSVDGWPHIIARVNIPSQPSPFMVVDDGSAQVKTWWDPPVAKPGLFNTYLHWPISRGIRTTWLDDPRDFERPTHSNLVNIVHREAVSEADHREWYWLIGVARRDRDMQASAASWLTPGTVTVSGGVATGYDRTQRAYTITADPQAARIQVTVAPEGAGLVNPAFVVSGANRRVTQADCSVPPRRVAVGREREGHDLVVWLQGRFPEGLTLTLH